jgi:hypothetical protein
MPMCIGRTHHFYFFQHNQLCDTLLPITPCTHKLKAGIAYSIEQFNTIFYVMPVGNGEINKFFVLMLMLC